MSCDGTPGNPGLERVGDELYTCTGCPSCKRTASEYPGLPDPENIPGGLEYRRIGTEIHQAMEAFYVDDLSGKHQQIKEDIADAAQPTPEEMAAQMGVPLADLAGALSKGIGDLTEQLTEIAKAFQAPPKPSRAHRRAMKFGQAGLHGNYSNQKGKRR